MTSLPSRPRAFVLVSVAGLGLVFCGPQAVLLSHAAAQTVDGAPVLAPTPATQPARDGIHTAETPHSDAKSRRLAPYNTFYIMSYVSARTGDGVDGFVPGQEVHLVDVNRDKHTLVVTDGHAQIELGPEQLTNDLDIAAMVRQKDQAGQARIAEYQQAEQAAYRKYEREQVEASAQDVSRINREQAAASTIGSTGFAPQTNQSSQTAQADSAAQPADAAVASVDGGYYGQGGYGYGSPYGYFSGGTSTDRRVDRNGTGTGRGSTESGAGAAGTNTGSNTPATNPSTVGTAGSATAGAPAAPTGGERASGGSGGARH